ncbi:Outer membrane protein assembly factor BamB precursor [Pseudobythopirellula maris]|uniref:Outer membrane protein assembly factor BamB n=1 Tax=Pseudobythopirellula maris TaxID=2527991 RepID=A0A5C5ZPD5_9BACT|nr:PQQ-binding-like beta-propeller repeat protein [Pseudobythopirellula maris]TWT88747.1 Outer membrane protein assembly factor BamB precursor [Pseudobythopirellula maris]
MKHPMHRAFRKVFLALAIAAGSSAAAHAALVSADAAAYLGLDRDWSTQAPIDTSRSRVAQSALAGDRLYVLSTAGVLQSVDTATGASLWTTRLGDPRFPSLGVAAQGEDVAVVNGTTLYVFDSANGRERFHAPLKGAPGAGPVIAAGSVFVPLIDGRIEALAIDRDKGRSWSYQASGNLFYPGAVGEERVFFANTSGELFAVASDRSGAAFRYETDSPIVAPPAPLGGMVYIATRNGYLHALDQLSGQQRWRGVVGEIVSHGPHAIDGRVYLLTDAPSMHAFDAATGEMLWHTSGIERFVSASDKRVHAIDRRGALVVLDRETGRVVSRRSVGESFNTVRNDENDRLFLLTDSGYLQCLHEKSPEKGEADAATETPAADEPAADDPADAPIADDPFAVIEEEEEPFTADEPEEPVVEEPAEEEPAAEDPFNAADPFGGDDPFGGEDPFGDF